MNTHNNAQAAGTTPWASIPVITGDLGVDMLVHAAGQHLDARSPTQAMDPTGLVEQIMRDTPCKRTTARPTADRFSMLLRQLRQRARLTQEQLAELSGVGTSTISRFETGERTHVLVAVVQMLADALRLAPDERDELLAAAVDTNADAIADDPTKPMPRQLRVLNGSDTTTPFEMREADSRPLTLSLGNRATRDGTRVRIGGLVRGIAADIPDPDGWLWALLESLDGSRTVDEVVADLLHRFPNRPADEIRSGINELIKAGYLEEADSLALNSLSAPEKERYSRSATLFRWLDRAPHATWDTQMLLRQARVAVVGIGGVGSTAALALTMSGIGHLHCVDPDMVELSNLNRQILFTERDLGRPKVDAAVERLREHNSDIHITGEQLPIHGLGSLRTLAIRFDVLLLATDQPQEIRSWANQACQETGTAWVHSGYHGHQANIGLYQPGTGPCYECGHTVERQHLAEPPSQTPSTASATHKPRAANAVSAGITGQLAAHAATSLITGAPPLRRNCQYQFNLATFENSIAPGLTSPRPDCPTCAPDARLSHRSRY